MKNGKKAIGLALTALSVVALSSCNNVTKKSNGEILTYNYNGQELKITTDDIINKYLNEDRTEHAKAFYDALYEVVVRASFEEGGELASDKKTVETKAKEEIINAKDQADSEGKSWHDFLEEKGYKDVNTTDAEREQEFYLDKLYEAMTARVDKVFDNKFNDWNDAVTDELQKQYNTIWGEEGYLNQRLPYHVKHILVKVDASETTGEYSRGHISSANCEKLYQTVTRLVEGDTFSSVAKNFTDDTASAPTGGEYIMDIEAGFVNEFQLGIYTYDTLLNPKFKDEKGYGDKENKLHIPDNVEKQLKDFGVTYIPYGVIEEMNRVKDIEKNKDGISIYNGDADYFPRNIYFNKYFQNRNVAFITNEAAWTKENLTIDNKESGYHKITDDISGKTIFTDINDQGKYTTNSAKATTKVERFHELTIGGEKKEVLCDENGNPILVVRNQESSGGIHFITIERSAFDESGKLSFNKTAYAAAGLKEEDFSKYYTPLNQYYATNNPKERDGYNSLTNAPYYVKDFPNVELKDNGNTIFVPKKTFVQTTAITPDNVKDGVYSRVSDYASRIQTITKQLDTMDSVTQFTKYEWLNSKLDIKLNKFNNADIQSLVEKYIQAQKLTISRNSEKAIQDKWYQYARSITEQSNERKYNLLPEILAADYGNADLYKEGNPGYNPKYDSITAGRN